MRIAQEDILQRPGRRSRDLQGVQRAVRLRHAATARRYGDLLIKPDLDKARQLLKESGYDGTPIVMMQQTDLQSSNQRPAGRQAAAREGGLQGRPAGDGLADRGVAPRPQGGAATRAAGTSSSPPTSPSTPTTRPATPSPAAPATRRGSAGRAIRRWRSCAPPSCRETDPDKQKAIGFAISDRVMDQGTLRRARPVQGVRRLPQGPRLGLAARPGAGGVEHQQEVS